jgi:hypothetical protein
MDAYRLGTSRQLALYITKKYKSHRRLNNVHIDLVALEAGMKIKHHRRQELV